ncbi:coatomer protein gamma subunit [Cyclospora cayetanensis]|uniref:Coatomer protein gamma subunit n=1 Tax=Cyclospora cayetanensis TaxID=88456 RepID=A0A1D3D998_9EIME|nr:coatomer protein gamma subunit [Cyclospora cayetanensis]
MKSYLDTPPLMKLALSDQLSIGSSGLSEGGALCTDSCNFHECVDLALFESQRLLTFRPPDGEFVLLNYRAVSVSHVPFRVLPTVEELGNGKVDVILRIRADLPEQSCAANVSVSVSLPKATTSVALESMPPVAAQGMEFIAAEHRIHWLIKKFQGGCELSFRVRVTLNPALPPPLRSEYGPATLGFEIPMYNVSSLQVRYLRVAERDGAFNPFRWVKRHPSEMLLVLSFQGRAVVSLSHRFLLWVFPLFFMPCLYRLLRQSAHSVCLLLPVQKAYVCACLRPASQDVFLPSSCGAPTNSQWAAALPTAALFVLLPLSVCSSCMSPRGGRGTNE